MRIRDLMAREVVTCQATDDLGTAGKRMIRAGCGSLPVCGDGGKLVGFLTDRDISSYLCSTDRRPSEARAAAAMREEIWSCGPEDRPAEAMVIMRSHHVRRLPVLDDDGRLIGIVSLDDIAMQARPAVIGTYDGPLDTDVAATLRAVGHALPHPH